jgi:hypothetical protein
MISRVAGTEPPVVEEILRLDVDGCANWLLRQLDEAPPGETGENFISERVAEWFPGAKAIGAKRQLDQTGIPTAASTRPTLVERHLRDAYHTLVSRGFIRPDPGSGKTFCEITGAGRQQLTTAPGVDQERMGFAAKAMTFELHPALQARSIDTNFRQGRFETALRDSSAFLEDAIR